ncbi:hypothetical protein ACFTWH_06335 [Streptomyces sp. NPDC057011]|uniref:hypothetical protein n=1 Tax=unclassified Streptomyces TaxID=2593676 RepID=UPI00363C680E
MNRAGSPGSELPARRAPPAAAARLDWRDVIPDHLPAVLEFAAATGSDTLLTGDR